MIMQWDANNIKIPGMWVNAFENNDNDVTEPRNGAYQKNKLRKLDTELRKGYYGAP